MKTFLRIITLSMLANWISKRFHQWQFDQASKKRFKFISEEIQEISEVKEKNSKRGVFDV